MIMMQRFAIVAMSAAPPLPGRRVFLPFSSTQCVFKLPKRSTSAPPMKPRSTRPLWRRYITSLRLPQQRARATLGGSLMVKIDSRAGQSRMTPFSKIPNALGACSSLATAKPKSGSRMPTKTFSPSRISRAAAATINSLRV